MNAETSNSTGSALRLSKVGRLAVGVVCVFGLCLSALLIFYAVSPWFDHAHIPFFGSRLRDSTTFSVSAAVSICITICLARVRLWAWWTALAVAVLTLAIAIFLLVATLFPRDDFARSEGGFGFFLSVCIMVPGLLSTIFLILPCVRRRF